MSKSYLSLLIFLIASMIIISSCKRDAPAEDLAVIEVDFLLNERDLERFGLDYTPQDFERDTEDPNRVLTVRVGEPVKFKDTSKGSSSATIRKWVLNDNEWKQAQNDKEVHVPEFTHVFEEAGYHRISLYVGESNYATKLINVVSGDYVPNNIDVAGTDEVADVPEDDVVASVDDSPEVKDDLFGDAPKDKTPVNDTRTVDNTPPPSRTKTNPTPTRPPSRPVDPKPAPAKITSINFVMPSEVMVGESFEIKDVSAPASAVTIRQWDMGDGSTRKEKGSVARQMYFSAGERTITLCLNNSNQCTSKRIMVKPRPPRKEEVATNKPAPTPEPPVAKKPEVGSVAFNMAKTAVVGTSVSLSDRSQPSSAVMKRNWSFGDGTANLNTGRSSVAHVFNKAGTFTVKLCVNDSDKCSTETITITEKPKPAPPVVASTSGSSGSSGGGFDLSNYDGSRLGRVGLLSSQKCDDANFEWHEGAAFINISPKQPMELEEAKVYASKNGNIDIILTTKNKKESGVIKNVQVNPGASVVYLTDLAVILEPGTDYTLMIKPSEGSSDLKLENAVKCSPKPLGSKEVSVNYNKKYILYDLKFYF